MGSDCILGHLILQSIAGGMEGYGGPQSVRAMLLWETPSGAAMPKLLPIPIS